MRFCIILKTPLDQRSPESPHSLDVVASQHYAGVLLVQPADKDEKTPQRVIHCPIELLSTHSDLAYFGVEALQCFIRRVLGHLVAHRSVSLFIPGRRLSPARSTIPF